MSTDETPPERDPFAGPEWDGPRRASHSTSAPRESAESAEGDREVRRERRRRSKYAQRKKRRRWLLAGGVVVLALVAGVAWLLYTGLRARHELEIVRAEVRQLRSSIAAGDLDRARTVAGDLRRHAGEAHDLTTGPAWAAGAAVPWLGDPLDSARTITASVDQVADSALPALVDASRNLDPSTLRGKDGAIDLKAIDAVAPPLDDAAAALSSASAAVDHAPASTWLGTVDSARADLAGQLAGLSATVNYADVAAQTLPTMLGADGPKLYMVGFQNEAELRGTGGLPGAFGILRVDHGAIHFVRFESDTELRGVDSGLDFGADYARLWTGSNSTSDYLDSNVSAHFPYTGQIWAAMWQAKTGQKLDGAITLDPTALSYLLKVTGGAKLADGTRVTARNVVALTQNTAYLDFGQSVKARKAYLLQLAKAVSDKLIDSGANTTALVRAAAHAVSEHRLLVWSADDSVEQKLAATKISGAVPDSSAPYAGIALNNGAANKLDYYLDASADIAADSCAANRAVTVTLTLKSTVPGNLTDYMYGGYGKPHLPKNRGDNLTLLSYYATAGSQLTAVTVDGKASTAGSGSERGHPVYTLRVELAPGQQTKIVLHLREPKPSGPLTVRAQPMVRPMQVSTSVPSCGS